jgi:hypothetical protein
VDNFVESFPLLAHSRRKIKSLTLAAGKTAALQFVENQPLSGAMDFGAAVRLKKSPDRVFCA